MFALNGYPRTLLRNYGSCSGLTCVCGKLLLYIGVLLLLCKRISRRSCLCSPVAKAPYTIYSVANTLCLASVDSMIAL